MTRPRIVLAGLGPKLDGLTWESETVLRIGRQDSLDIVLNDATVCRRHAEVVHTGDRWVIRDLARNERHPILVNGQRLEREDRKLRQLDVIQCGAMSLKVTTLEDPGAASDPILPSLPEPAAKPSHKEIRTSGGFVRVHALTNNSWDQALQNVALQATPQPQQGQGMLTLLRTGCHLRHIADLDVLLQSILGDAVAALSAQRASILLVSPLNSQLELRAWLDPGEPVDSARYFSRTLAHRAFQQGESLLCRDVQADTALFHAGSIRQGTMTSIICAVLRTPRKKLGIMQLDRGLFQDPFNENDLYLADAMAASVAVAIESAQLVEEQRDQFVQTVTSLARAVEFRDQYTGNHTRRVTDYALLLAEELKLPATDKYQIQIGTPLHDIGKIAIDDAILRKPGKLSDAEFEFMKTHTIKGAAILQSICNLGPMIPIVRHHHERWDGTGYPDGLSRDQISQTARIVAVADAFDAMTSHRPYRPAMPADRAFFELLSKAGGHFDPACVHAFLRLRPRVEEMLRESKAG
jgi:hypothetical protein